MRLHLVLALTAMTAIAAAAPAASQPDAASQLKDGFDDRGYDRQDRTPDWNYRRGESQAKGAYYDGGRYGPRGLLRSDALDPWLAQAAASERVVTSTPDEANRWFRKRADRNRDARITDEEIRVALNRMENRRDARNR